ncbi:MAG: hypothetical protein AAFO51_09800 [Pseudomonadota bacterium]
MTHQYITINADYRS